MVLWIGRRGEGFVEPGHQIAMGEEMHAQERHEIGRPGAQVQDRSARSVPDGEGGKRLSLEGLSGNTAAVRPEQVEIGRDNFLR